MDEDEIFQLIKNCKHLQFNFVGVYAADNFPPKLNSNKFMIVNTSNSNSIGLHWTFIGKKQNDVYFVDPLGFSLKNYPNILSRLLNIMTEEIFDASISLQNKNSELCGLYCIYIAHYFNNDKILNMPIIDDLRLLQFVKHMI